MNVRITAKYQTHLQTFTNTSAKFQNGLAKTVEGVKFTRFCDRQSDGQRDRGMQRETICRPTLSRRRQLISCIQKSQLVSVVELTGLSITRSHIWKTGFLKTVPKTDLSMLNWRVEVDLNAKHN